MVANGVKDGALSIGDFVMVNAGTGFPGVLERMIPGIRGMMVITSRLPV